MWAAYTGDHLEVESDTDIWTVWPIQVKPISNFHATAL